MESVPPAIIVIFIILLAMLTFSGAIVVAQQSTEAMWREMQARQSELAQTGLSAVSGRILDNGTQLEVVVRNTGSLHLADFKRWDLIVQYEDDATPTGYHMGWLPYTVGRPGPGQWSLYGIFLNTSKLQPEIFEPGILNPGEEAVLQVGLLPALGSHKTLQVVLAGPGGHRAALILTRDEIPTLVNANAIVTRSQTFQFNDTALLTTDPDNTPAELTYTVISAPGRGRLSLGRVFTQEAITNGLLSYQHDGGSEIADRFEFRVSDGTNTIGPYTFEFSIN